MKEKREGNALFIYISHAYFFKKRTREMIFYRPE